jgi:hypothetical protein
LNDPLDNDAFESLTFGDAVHEFLFRNRRHLERPSAARGPDTLLIASHPTIKVSGDQGLFFGSDICFDGRSVEQRARPTHTRFGRSRNVNPTSIEDLIKG